MISETVRSDSARLASFEPADASLNTSGDRYARLVALPTAELERVLRHDIESEHELPDPIRYPAVRDRLRAWLTLDPEHARMIVRAHEGALATFPAEYAARRREAESAVMLNGLRFAEFRALAELLRWPEGDDALAVFAAALEDDAAERLPLMVKGRDARHARAI